MIAGFLNHQQYEICFLHIVHLQSTLGIPRDLWGSTTYSTFGGNQFGLQLLFSIFSSPAEKVAPHMSLCTMWQYIQHLWCCMILSIDVNSGLIKADHTSLMTKTLATHCFPHYNSKIQLTNLLPANSQGGNLNLHVCRNHLRKVSSGARPPNHHPPLAELASVPAKLFHPNVLR